MQHPLSSPNQNPAIKAVYINSLENVQLVPIDEIIRLEASGNYTVLYLKSKKPIIVCKLLKKFEDSLPSTQFYRIHKSHIVNIGYIVQYVKTDGGHLEMIDKSQIPISRDKKKQFVEQQMRRAAYI